MMGKTKGAIAAGHPKTAEAGAIAFAAGGNAFDAAIAGLLTSFVSESLLTSAAGGGFLLAHTAAGRNQLFDFFSQTPRQQRPPSELNFYPVDLDFQGAIQQFHIGLGSIAVPGNLAGAFTVHRQLGRLPLSVVAEPAIAAARHGIPLNRFQHSVLQLLQPICTATPAARSLYTHPDGAPLQVGDRFAIPDFADALETWVVEGERDFYAGEVAATIARDCAEGGGHLTRADLEQYRVEIRQPLVTTYRDRTLVTNPPPSSGGTLIAFALGLLERYGQLPDTPGSVARIRHLAHIMRATNLARQDDYDRALYEPDIAERFLDGDRLRRVAHQYAEQYSPDLLARLVIPELQRDHSSKLGSTTHISTLDAEGNAASITSSNGEGSSYVIPGTGVMANNMLGEDDLNPHGFHQWQPNCRMSSMMAPTLVLEQGRPVLVLGSGGSNRIRTAILQVLCSVLDDHMDLAAAITAPRIHWERDRLDLEPGLEPPAAPGSASPYADLAATVTHWSRQSMFFGGVHGVARSPEGHFWGVGDARREGVAIVVESGDRG